MKISGGTNLAVAEFIGKNVSQADASIVADFLRTELVNIGMFHVMDRTNMDTVLAELNIQVRYTGSLIFGDFSKMFIIANLIVIC